MTIPDLPQLKMVFIICPKAKAKKTVKFLNEHGYGLHYVFLAKGTAPSEIAAYLGLSEPEKVFLTLVASEERAKALLQMIEKSEELDFITGQGIAFYAPLNSVVNMSTLKFVLNSSNKLDNDEEKV